VVSADSLPGYDTSNLPDALNKLPVFQGSQQRAARGLAVESRQQHFEFGISGRSARWCCSMDIG